MRISDWSSDVCSSDLGHPHGGEVADGPDGEADQPEAQAETHGSGQRPVHDGDGARCAAEQDMLGQRPVDGDGKPRHRVELFEAARHQMSAPPPKLKKLRKNELAAKARSEEHTSELQSLMRNSYAVFCLKK